MTFWQTDLFGQTNQDQLILQNWELFALLHEKNDRKESDFESSQIETQIKNNLSRRGKIWAS